MFGNRVVLGNLCVLGGRRLGHGLVIRGAGDDCSGRGADGSVRARLGPGRVCGRLASRGAFGLSLRQHVGDGCCRDVRGQRVVLTQEALPLTA